MTNQPKFMECEQPVRCGLLFCISLLLAQAIIAIFNVQSYMNSLFVLAMAISPVLMRCFYWEDRTTILRRMIIPTLFFGFLLDCVVVPSGYSDPLQSFISLTFWIVMFAVASVAAHFFWILVSGDCLSSRFKWNPGD